MKNFTFTALSLLALTTVAHADSYLVLKEKDDRVKRVITTTPFIEYNNRIAVFSPVHQAYERIKVDALYAGVEWWLNVANSHRNKGTLVSAAEFRMGYNYFKNDRDHLTPFAGVGFFKDAQIHGTSMWELNSLRIIRKHKTLHTRPAVAYGTVGFLYDHEFNSIFNLGARLKALIGGPVSKHRHYNWGTPVFGFEASVPFTFRFGGGRHWDIRIEPYDLYVHGHDHTNNYIGFRSTVGYRF